MRPRRTFTRRRIPAFSARSEAGSALSPAALRARARPPASRRSISNMQDSDPVSSNNGSDNYCNTNKTQTPLEKKVKHLYYFNSEWKITHNWIREVNNKNRAYCTVCTQEFEIGHGGQRDVEAHMKTECHKSRMRQASTSKSFKKDTNAQSKAAVAELALAYHTIQHASSYSSLDCPIKLIKAMFPDSEVATNMFCGQTTGGMLITDVLAPLSVELTLLDLTNDCAFYSISSDVSNHGNQKMFPLCLRYFDLKNGVSNRLLDFYEDYNETAENIKQRTVDILSKHQLDFAYLSAYPADSSAHGHFDKFHAVYELLTKENEKILAASCPAHLVHSTVRYGCDWLACDIESFKWKVFSHLSLCSEPLEELNEIFRFMETERVNPRHELTKQLSLLPAIEKMLKCWPAIKSYFQSLEQKECPFLIREFIEDESREEKDYSKTQIYMLFLQNVLWVFEETVRRLEKEELTAPELFDVMFRLRQQLLQRKNDSFFGNMTILELNKMSPEKASQVKQDFLRFFTRTIDYLESNFDFTNANYLCALTPFSLKTRSLTYEDIECASKCLKMMDMLDMDSLFNEYSDAKNLMNVQMAHKDKPVDKKWVDIFGEMKTKSYKFKNLLLLVSKILSIPCSNAFVEKIFSFISHWTDDKYQCVKSSLYYGPRTYFKNQCDIGLMRAELQVRLNFTFDCIQFCQYIKEKKDVLKAVERSEKYYWERKQKE